MKTLRIALIALTAALLMSCGGSSNKAAAERTSDIRITSYGVGPISFSGSSDLVVMKGYQVTMNTDTGILTVKAEDGEEVISKEWETITVKGYEFKTEEGIHVGMPIAEAVKLLDGSLRAYSMDENNKVFGICRHFDGPDVVEEDDNIMFFVDDSAIKEVIFDRVIDDPSSITAEDFEPEAKITKITVTELL